MEINEIKREHIGIAIFLFSIALYIITITKVNLGLNVDEAFSLMITNTNFMDTISLTASDVHPPLYYLILKVFMKIFAFENIDRIIIAKLFSIIPTLLLLIVSYTKIRKEFGWLVCGIFALCIASMPNFMYYNLTIRMYPFAMFFVTMVFLIAYDLTERNDLKNWILITIFTIASFYTHYYAVIACSIIYAILLVYFILNNRNQIKYLIVSFVASVLAYIPWVYVILSQINKYQGDYWIQPLYLQQLIETYWYVFSSYTTSSEIIGVLLTIAVFILVLCYVKDKNKEKKDHYAVIALSIIILTIISGLLVSVLVMPLFNQRYIFPVLGIFWLGFSILLAKNYDNKKIFALCLVILLCASGINTIYFINSEDIGSRNMAVLENVTFEDGDVIIHDNLHTQLTYERWYYPQCDNYNYDDGNTDFVKITNDTLANNHTVWVFYRDSGDTRLRGSDGAILNDFSKSYNLEQVAQLEADPFNNLPTGIYKVNTR